MDVDAGSRDEAEARTRQMCDKLLANPVTEDYLLDIEED
jgi:phosphoribosylformylglycinamidine synthase PurS subunit